MPDKFPEEVSNVAKFGFLIFGDGYTAQILQMHPSINQKNQATFDIILRPSDEMIKAFNINKNASCYIPRTDGSVLIRKEIPYEHIKQLNPDPAWTRWLYLGDYNGHFQPAIMELFPTHLLDEIRDLKNKLETEKAKRAVAEEKMKLMDINLPKHFHKNIAPMLTDLMDAAGKLLPQKPGVKND